MNLAHRVVGKLVRPKVVLFVILMLSKFLEKLTGDARFLIVLLNMLLTLKLGPFVDAADDELSFLGSLQMLLTLLLGLLLKTDDPTNPTYDHQFMGVVLVLLNVLPFLALASSLALLHPKVRERINACSDGIKSSDGKEKEREVEKKGSTGQKQHHDTKVAPSGRYTGGGEDEVKNGTDAVRTWS